VCLVLRDVNEDWDKELLSPLLTDSRTWGWTDAVEEGKNEPRLIYADLSIHDADNAPQVAGAVRIEEANMKPAGQ